MQSERVENIAFKPVLSFDCGICEINLDKSPPQGFVHKKVKQVATQVSAVVGKDDKCQEKVSSSMSPDSGDSCFKAPKRLYFHYDRNHLYYGTVAAAAAREAQVEVEREPQLLSQPITDQRLCNDASVSAQAQNSFADTIVLPGNVVDPKAVAALCCGHLFHAICLQGNLSEQSVPTSKFFKCPKCDIKMGKCGIIRVYPSEMDPEELDIGPTAEFLNGICSCENPACKNYWDQSRFVCAEEYSMAKTHTDLCNKTTEVKKNIKVTKKVIKEQNYYLDCLNRDIEKYQKIIDNQNLPTDGAPQQ